MAVRPAAPPGRKPVVYDVGGGKTVPQGDAGALAAALRSICKERALQASAAGGKMEFVVELQAERDAAWSAVAPVFKAVAEAKIPEMILVAGVRRISAPLPEAGRTPKKAPPNPIRIGLRPAGKDGEGVVVKLGDREMGPTGLPGEMAKLAQQVGGEAANSLVIIQADGAVRWEHIVTTYHHVQERGFTWIGFAP